MSRLKDAILGDVAYGRNAVEPMLDLTFGGEFGWMTDYPAWISNAQYVRRNLIAILVESPTGFQQLPEPAKWVAALKQLVEEKCKRIEGFQAMLEVETINTPFGGSGEVQDQPVNVTRQASQPQFTWDEKYGRPINAFLEAWISELIMDPVTKFPNAVTRGLGTDAVPDLLPDFYSMTVLFIEPDPTHQYVDKAWLCTNMFPKSGGEVVGKKDQTAAADPQEYTVTFTAISQVGNGVRAFAQSILSQLSVTGGNPNNRPAFVQGITSAVQAATDGYTDELQAQAAVTTGVNP